MAAGCGSPAACAIQYNAITYITAQCNTCFFVPFDLFILAALCYLIFLFAVLRDVVDGFLFFIQEEKHPYSINDQRHINTKTSTQTWPSQGGASCGSPAACYCFVVVCVFVAVICCVFCVFLLFVLVVRLVVFCLCCCVAFVLFFLLL